MDAQPVKWDNGYFDTLFGYEWQLTKSPQCASVGGQERRRQGHGAGCPRSVETTCSHNDYCGYGAPDGSDL